MDRIGLGSPRQTQAAPFGEAVPLVALQLTLGFVSNPVEGIIISAAYGKGG